MSPSQWGPPTWIFLHTLVAKIKDEQFPVIGQQVIANIIQICLFLPCPECSVHAKQFWANVVTKNINNSTGNLSSNILNSAIASDAGMSPAGVKTTPAVSDAAPTTAVKPPTPTTAVKPPSPPSPPPTIPKNQLPGTNEF